MFIRRVSKPPLDYPEQAGGPELDQMREELAHALRDANVPLVLWDEWICQVDHVGWYNRYIGHHEEVANAYHRIQAYRNRVRPMGWRQAYDFKLEFERVFKLLCPFDSVEILE